MAKPFCDSSDRRKARGLLLFAALIVAAAGFWPAYAAESDAKEAEPLTPLHSLVTADDYPAEAMANNEQGNVEFLLTIGTDGQPMDCIVTNSSGSSSLDSASCLIMMERARFRPAKNSSGKPTVSSYQNRIAWRLSDEGPLAGFNASPVLNSAATLWTTCIWGEVAKLVSSELLAPEVTSRALTVCLPLENRIVLEMRTANLKDMDPAKRIPELKKAVTEKISQMLDNFRKYLKEEVRK